MPLADLLCLVLFALLWLGYAPAVRRLAPSSINAGLTGVRISWMRSMLRRDNRIVDSSLIGHVVHSASFFASTSLIVIGALLSLLSSAEHLQPAIESLSFVTTVPRALFELKIVLPLLVLVHGFVRLTWSIRQLNYTIALVGGAPERQELDGRLEPLADSIGEVMSVAMATFNEGIRAYYFALAGLAWLIGPFAMAGAALVLVAMLVWRQIESPAAVSFRKARDLLDEAHAARENDLKVNR